MCVAKNPVRNRVHRFHTEFIVDWRTETLECLLLHLVVHL